MKKKTILKWVCGILAAVLIVVAAGAWAMFGTFIRAASSIEKLEDGLYAMEFDGDYGFDEFLAQGGAVSDSALADYLVTFLSHGFYKVESDVQTGDFGCSTICVKDDQGTVFFGRNYDWEECKTMIVHTKPKSGYESVSTCCLDFLGFSAHHAPDGSMLERMEALAAVYVPLDGMNEKGLVVADLMAGDDEVTHQQTDKADLTTTTAIRLLLDQAATVDEAVALLGQYDMNSSIGSARHLSIADASGKIVVVEYVGGEMLVTETKWSPTTTSATAKSKAWAPSSPTSALTPCPRIPALPMKWMSGICWNPWPRKTTPSQRAAMKRPCGASSIARRAAALISTSRRTMNKATGCCFRTRAAF